MVFYMFLLRSSLNIKKLIFNLFSHCLFCDSRLTAIYHMRHPLKADLCKKPNTIMVPVCASVRPNTPREMIQNRATETNFYVFRYNFGCWPPI
jgi:hypothetical protein